MLTEDQIFRLTPADYADEFQALITFLKEAHGERFRSATLYYYDNRTIIRVSEFVREQITTAPYPLSAYPEMMLLHIFLANKTYIGETPYYYFLDRIGVGTYSHPFGRKPIKDWVYRVRNAKFHKVAKARMAPIKEELMAAAWAPHRVERLIAAGGLEALD
jgi:hypothetical protein